MKKIMAFVLSIAVLFAFAACEAGTIPPYYGKNVDSITLMSAPDYIVGETLNPADLSFRVVYDDGQEATRTGAELGLAPTKTENGKTEINQAADYVLRNAKEFGIVYGTTKPTTGGSVDNKAIWTCTIKPVAVADVEFTVNPSNAAKEIKKGVSELTDADIAGIVVTAEFANGNTKTVSADIAEITTKTFVPVVDGTTATVYVAPSVSNVTISPEWVLDVVEETRTITGITFDYNDELFSNATTKTTLDDVEFKVTVTYDTGKPDEYATRSAFTSAGGTIDFNGYYDSATNIQDVSKSSINFTATVTYNGYTNENVALRGTYAQDYPTVFTAQLKSQYASGGTDQLSAPATVTSNMFDYTFSQWASGDSYSGTTAPASASDIYVANADILTGETGNHTVYLYWANEDLRDKVNRGTAVTVTVPIKAAE